MPNIDYLGILLYLAFGAVLTLSGHDIEDITYWLLFFLLLINDVRSTNRAYDRGLTDGSAITKKVWGIK